ncbi:MAG TPA: hypothetical protein DIW27_07420 [Cytophagales bacterium]|nr:hypothetical protein [Cytophagales bacterium]
MRTITLFSIVLLTISCQDETISPDKIIYKDLGNITVDYYNPYRLDVDGDGNGDFVFSTSLLNNASGGHLQFTFYPALANHVYAHRDEVVVLNPGDRISPDYDYTKWIQPLATKTESDTEIYWHGAWMNASNQYIGVRIKLSSNEDYHYGWIRVSFDKANERLILHDLAYHSKAGEGMVI